MLIVLARPCRRMPKTFSDVSLLNVTGIFIEIPRGSGCDLNSILRTRMCTTEYMLMETNTFYTFLLQWTTFYDTVFRRAVAFALNKYCETDGYSRTEDCELSE